jgi:hypothetical protein
MFCVTVRLDGEESGLSIVVVGSLGLKLRALHHMQARVGVRALQSSRRRTKVHALDSMALSAKSS